MSLPESTVWTTWTTCKKFSLLLMIFAAISTVSYVQHSHVREILVKMSSIRNKTNRVSFKRPLKDELTVVTAYFNIGSFEKGKKTNIFTPDLYKHWFRVFQLIKSPVIGYFDTDEYADLFSQLRRRFPSNMTVVHRVNRSELWSFRLVPEIARIFAQPDYPKHTPNTILPTYSASMHAKYEVTQLAIDENPFNTRYFCWLDIGLFRDISQSDVSSEFPMYLPPNFDNSSVAYQQPYGPRDEKATPKKIVYDNMFWICGCFFVGDATVLSRWIQEYKAAAYHMVNVLNLMSTDQQVIYTALNTMNISTKLQIYHPDGRYNCYFHLGYLARDAGIARQKRHT